MGICGSKSSNKNKLKLQGEKSTHNMNFKSYHHINAYTDNNDNNNNKN